MKKIICFLAFTSLFAVSCTSDSDDAPINNPDTSVVLLKKTIETDADGATFTSTATYDGTKLVKIMGDDNIGIYFTYEGDNIMQMTYKLGTTTFQTDTFTYNAEGKMASYTRVEPIDDLGSKEVYTYNANGNVSVASYSGDAASQTLQGGTGTITFTNGEITHIETGDGAVLTYTYDSKNHPFKNVAGVSKISYADRAADGIAHNILVETTSTDDDVVNTYTYNANDYPQSAVQTYGTEETVTQFFYE